MGYDTPSGAATGAVVLASETRGSYGALATVTLGDLSGFRELQIVARLSSNRASTVADDVGLRLNGDTAVADYDYAVIDNIPLARANARLEPGYAYGGICPTDDGGFLALGLITMIIPFPGLAIRHAIQTESTKINSGGVYKSLCINGVSWHMAEEVISSVQIYSVWGADFRTGSSLTIYGVR